MKKYREPKVIRDLHKIREQIYREATAAGLDRYYKALNKKAGWLLGSRGKTRTAAVRETKTPYRTTAR